MLQIFRLVDVKLTCVISVLHTGIFAIDTLHRISTVCHYVASSSHNEICSTNRQGILLNCSLMATSFFRFPFQIVLSFVELGVLVHPVG